LEKGIGLFYEIKKDKKLNACFPPKELHAEEGGWTK
jgi:hypothetical protein